MSKLHGHPGLELPHAHGDTDPEHDHGLLGTAYALHRPPGVDVCCCGHLYGEHVNWETDPTKPPRYSGCPMIDMRPKHHCRCDAPHPPTNHHSAGGEPYANSHAIDAMRSRIRSAMADV